MVLNTTPVKPRDWVGCQILKHQCQISHPLILVELAHESGVVFITFNTMSMPGFIHSFLYWSPPRFLVNELM